MTLVESTRCSRAMCALVFAMLCAAAIVEMTVASPAAADLAGAKAVVEAAKARGEVGEQGDGYLGFVGSTRAPQVVAAVNEINVGRAGVYRDAAAKTGVTEAAAGEAAAVQLFNMVRPGQYYKPVNGNWTKK